MAKLTARQERLQLLFREANKRKILDEFLMQFTSLTGLLVPPEVLSFNDSKKIKKKFVIDQEFFEGKKGLRIQTFMETPEEINAFIQRLAFHLKNEVFYLEFCHYDIGLLQINDSHILKKWQSLLDFDGDTIFIFSPETNICVVIDLAQDFLIAKGFEYGRHWIYDLSLAGTI